jgi:hypothetical protein
MHPDDYKVIGKFIDEGKLRSQFFLTSKATQITLRFLTQDTAFKTN